MSASQEGTAIEFLTAGDCFTGPRTEPIDMVTVIPCASPHESPVVVTFELPEGSYPGKDEVTAQAQQGCADKGTRC